LAGKKKEKTQKKASGRKRGVSKKTRRGGTDITLRWEGLWVIEGGRNKQLRSRGGTERLRQGISHLVFIPEDIRGNSG